MDPDPVGRVHTEGSSMKVLTRGHQAPRNDPVVEDLRRPVDIGEERLQGLHPLHDAGRQNDPFLLGDDAGHQVEGERSLLAG